MDFLWLAVGAAIGGVIGAFGVMAIQRPKLLAEKSAATTRAQEAERQLALLRDETTQARADRESAERARHEAEKQSEALRTRLSEGEKRIAEWEQKKVQERDDTIQLAKAATISAGNEINKKFLEDHQRESQAQQKQNEEITRKINEGLTEQVKVIAEKLGSLKDDQHKSERLMSTIWRTLSTPAAAGQLAETGLENLLKNFGLIPEQDFFLQSSFEGDAGRRRPDAYIPLPQNRLMLIDCKTSKFLFDHADAQTEQDQGKAMEGLRATMQMHLKALSQRDYRSAVLDDLRKRRADGESIPPEILTVMYVPSELVIEKIREADASFIARATKEGIILAGPASLYAAISMANTLIRDVRKAEKHHEIIGAAEKLMDGIIPALGHIVRLGKSIKGAVTHFDAFAGSVRTNVLPRMRDMIDSGATPAKQKDLPSTIASVFQGDDLIEAEVETVEADRLPRLAPKIKAEA